MWHLYTRVIKAVTIPKLSVYLFVRYTTLFFTVFSTIIMLSSMITIVEKYHYYHTLIGYADWLQLLATTALSVFSVSLWLALIILIFILQRRNEWESAIITGANKKQLFFILTHLALILCTAILVAKALCLDTIAAPPQRYITDIVSIEENGTITHARTYDTHTHHGTNLTIYRPDSPHITYAQTFTANLEKITTENATSFYELSPTQTIPTLQEQLPHFTHTLQLHSLPSSWLSVLKQSLYAPQHTMWASALSHLQPIIEGLLLNTTTSLCFLWRVVPPQTLLFAYPLLLILKEIIGV